MRSRRVTWVVLRQDLKAFQEESTALVASDGEAEEAWWTMEPLLAWVTGMDEDVDTGWLSIQRGIVEVESRDMLWCGCLRMLVYNLLVYMKEVSLLQRGSMIDGPGVPRCLFYLCVMFFRCFSIFSKLVLILCC